MTPTPQESEPWMPNGFPPPSFVVETERVSAFAGARGRWLAAAAILGALLLIAGVLLIARQDDGRTALTAGTTTTVFGDTTLTTPTTALEPTASLPPAANTVPGDTGTTIPATPTTGARPGATTAAPPPAAGAGVLAAASTLTIPKVDANAGPGSAQMALRNNGNASLSFNSQTNFSGLTVGPPTGTIAAGREVVVTITLNGAAAAEGPFTGIVSFGGTGGTQRVTVTSQVARLPVISENADAVRQCPTEGPTCSRLIDAPGEAQGLNPCTTDGWVFKVNVSDDSGVSRVQALGPGVALKTANPTPTSAVWQSDPQPKILPGVTYKFTIEAVDKFENIRRTTERTITCPAA